MFHTALTVENISSNSLSSPESQFSDLSSMMPSLLDKGEPVGKGPTEQSLFRSWFIACVQPPACVTLQVCCFNESKCKLAVDLTDQTRLAKLVHLC